MLAEYFQEFHTVYHSSGDSDSLMIVKTIESDLISKSTYIIFKCFYVTLSQWIPTSTLCYRAGKKKEYLLQFKWIYL